MIDSQAVLTRKRVLLAAATASAFAIAVAVGVWANGEDRSPSDLPTMTADAGDVTVKATPTRLGPDDAVFNLSLVSTTTDLSFALERAATLTVAGVEWGPATWDGVTAATLVREGRLEFHAKGPVRGTAVLRIDGLPATVELRWRL